MVEIYRKKTPETDSEIYRYYEKIASQYGIPLIPPIEDYLRRINAGLSQRPTQINFLGENTRILPIAQRQALPLDIRTSPDEKTRLAGLYFLELIKPSLASGKDETYTGRYSKILPTIKRWSIKLCYVLCFFKNTVSYKNWFTRSNNRFCRN